MINVKNLYLGFNKEFYALYNISFHVNKGERVALVGEKDSGKTCLLRVLAGLESFNEGEVYVNNIPVKKINYKTDCNMAYIPKSPLVMNNKTVKENLEYVLKIRKTDQTSINFKVLTALKTYDIENIKDVKVKHLSEFQKMQLQLARASLRTVDLYLIDYILEGFTKSEKEKLLMYLDVLSKENPATFVYAFKNEKTAGRFDAKVIKLKYGSIEN